MDMRRSPTGRRRSAGQRGWARDGRPGGAGRGCPVPDVQQPRTAGRAEPDVRPDRGTRADRSRQDRGRQDQPDRRTALPPGPRTAMRDALHASAIDRRGGAPDGPRGRAPDPRAGESVVDRRPAGRVHAASQLGTAGHPGRCAERRVREHQLPGAGQEILARAGAARRLHLPGLRPEPLLHGLRRLRQHDEAEGTRRNGRDALAQELLRHHARDDLWDRCGRGRARGAAARGPHNHPFGRAAALPERAARAGPHDAAAGRVPGSARRGGPGIGAAGGPGHRGRSENHDRRRRAMGAGREERGQSWSAGRGHQPGEYRCSLHGADGL